MTTHDFQDGKGPVPAHQHCNGGGWVAESSKVDPTVYISSNALVYDEAQVSDYAQIIDSARIYGNAKVNDYVLVTNSARIYGNAKVKSHTRVSGDTELFGNAQVCGKDATKELKKYHRIFICKLAVLEILLLSSYALSRDEIEKRLSGKSTSLGTLSPVLKQLVKKGLIEKGKEDGLYTVTDPSY
jgi:uncharacterized membrane protein